MWPARQSGNADGPDSGAEYAEEAQRTGFDILVLSFSKGPRRLDAGAASSPPNRQAVREKRRVRVGVCAFSNFFPQGRPDSSVVERGPEKAGVGGSIPSLATTFQWTQNQPLRGSSGTAKDARICRLTAYLPLRTKDLEVFRIGACQLRARSPILPFMQDAEALTCCNSHSRDFLLLLVRRVVSQPDSASARCNGSGVTLTVAAEDIPLLTGQNNRMLRSLDTVHRALVQREDAAVSLRN